MLLCHAANFFVLANESSLRMLGPAVFLEQMTVYITPSIQKTKFGRVERCVFMCLYVSFVHVCEWGVEG